MELTLRPLGNGFYALDTPLMRSNSAVSDRSWVAEITGHDKRYVLARRFLKGEKDQIRSTMDGEQTLGGGLRMGTAVEPRTPRANTPPSRR